MGPSNSSSEKPVNNRLFQGPLLFARTQGGAAAGDLKKG
jgi:hypothetical protein